MIAVHTDDLSHIPAEKACKKCAGYHVDFVIFTNIAMVMAADKQSRGSRERVVRLKDLDLSDLALDEFLFIIGHGGPGFLGERGERSYTTARTLDKGTKDEVKGLGDRISAGPKKKDPVFRGVKIYSCHGAVNVPGMEETFPSIVKGFGELLSESGVSRVAVSGFTGYSYSNPHIGTTRVLKDADPNGQTSEEAERIQNDLLGGKYHDMLIAVDRFATQNARMPIAHRAGIIANMTRDFFKELIPRLGTLLYPVGDVEGEKSLVSMPNVAQHGLSGSKSSSLV